MEKKHMIGKWLAIGIILLFLTTSVFLPIQTKTQGSRIDDFLCSPKPPNYTRNEIKNPGFQQRTIAWMYFYGFMGIYGSGWYSSNPYAYLGPSILPNFPSGSDIDAEGNWFAVDYSGGIYQIFYDGYQVFIAPSIPLNSLTYDPSTELWYGVDAANLYTVDVTTGETSVVGPLNVPNTIIGISCNLAGEMYGYDVLWTGDSTLYSINKDTGSCTAIGPMGYGFVYGQDCSFDREADILYIAGYFNDGSPSALLICDVTTGQCTIVGPFEGGIEVDALTFPYGVSNWNLFPRANFTWSPSMPAVDEIIQFNASGSHDDDGYISLYEWDWENDSSYEESSTTPTITHSYPAPGGYVVNLRVTDDTGLTATTSHIVQVITGPPSPPVIHGPDNGFVNVSYTFTTDPITDPNGDEYYCMWEWGDGYITDWLGPYSSGSILSASHAWMQTGVYEIRIKLRNIAGASNWSEPHTITITQNHPPSPPLITGPSQGKIGNSYLFSFLSNDLDGDNVYYFVDWGDTTTTDWVGPYTSGTQIHLTHNWTEQGTYMVKAKAKDSLNLESEWGTFSITVPYEPSHFRFIEWLLERFPNAFPIVRFLFNTIIF